MTHRHYPQHIGELPHRDREPIESIPEYNEVYMAACLKHIQTALNFVSRQYNKQPDQRLENAEENLRAALSQMLDYSDR